MTIHVCPDGLYLQSVMSRLRDVTTSKGEFRRNAHLLGDILMIEVINRGLIPMKTHNLLTPTDSVVPNSLGLDKSSRICIVPIIRAGLSFVESALRIFPHTVDIGHLVIQRDEETAKPTTLLDKLPTNIADYDRVIILDPMLATGGSVISAIDCVVAKGVKEDKIVLVHALAASEGLEAVASRFDSISGVVGVVDEQLNEKKYIVPGLGDWGDRYN
jgi:uracil phosphoribosyltransferase